MGNTASNGSNSVQMSSCSKLKLITSSSDSVSPSTNIHAINSTGTTITSTASTRNSLDNSNSNSSTCTSKNDTSDGSTCRHGNVENINIAPTEENCCGPMSEPYSAPSIKRKEDAGPENMDVVNGRLFGKCDHASATYKGVVVSSSFSPAEGTINEKSPESDWVTVTAEDCGELPESLGQQGLSDRRFGYSETSDLWRGRDYCYYSFRSLFESQGQCLNIPIEEQGQRSSECHDPDAGQCPKEKVMRLEGCKKIDSSDSNNDPQVSHSLAASDKMAPSCGEVPSGVYVVNSLHGARDATGSGLCRAQQPHSGGFYVSSMNSRSLTSNQSSPSNSAALSGTVIDFGKYNNFFGLSQQKENISSNDHYGFVNQEMTSEEESHLQSPWLEVMQPLGETQRFEKHSNFCLPSCDPSSHFGSDHFLSNDSFSTTEYGRNSTSSPSNSPPSNLSILASNSHSGAFGPSSTAGHSGTFGPSSTAGHSGAFGSSSLAGNHLSTHRQTSMPSNYFQSIQSEAWMETGEFQPRLPRSMSTSASANLANSCQMLVDNHGTIKQAGFGPNCESSLTDAKCAVDIMYVKNSTGENGVPRSASTEKKIINPSTDKFPKQFCNPLDTLQIDKFNYDSNQNSCVHMTCFNDHERVSLPGCRMSEQGYGSYKEDNNSTSASANGGHLAPGRGGNSIYPNTRNVKAQSTDSHYEFGASYDDGELQESPEKSNSSLESNSTQNGAEDRLENANTVSCREKEILPFIRNDRCSKDGRGNEQESKDNLQEPRLARNSYLTTHDVFGQAPAMYSAFLCIAPQDVDLFGMPFAKMLESWGFHIFFPMFHLIPTGPYLENLVTVIKERCNGKVLAILSKSYPDSSECLFLTHFAKTLDPAAKTKNIIPIYIDKNVKVPHILEGLSSIGYNKAYNNFLKERLSKALSS